MSLWSRIQSSLSAIVRRSQMEGEMDAELRFHLEAYAEDLVRSGVSREEAMCRAHIEFGGVDRVKEECREARGVGILETFWLDTRYGLRTLRKSPGFTIVAVVTLALGIGANTLVFSVVNALVLRPLPVARPNELVFLENSRFGPGHSFPNYRYLRDRNRTFGGLVGYRIAPMEMETDTGVQRIWGYLATGNYFDVLGIQPVLGRFFTRSEDVHPGASPYAVLSYNAWRRDLEQILRSLAKRFI
jgi:hypothetical protein